MADSNKLIAMAYDNILHKQIVLQNCLIMSEYFLRNNEIDLGVGILRRGVVHDNSKFDRCELLGLSEILTQDRGSFKDATVQLTPDQEKVIEYHWSRNRHHPEYHNNHEDMSELDIIEMVCDWYARSKQYKTDFIPFVKERQKNRFKFNSEMFELILKYCELIVELDKEYIKSKEFKLYEESIRHCM